MLRKRIIAAILCLACATFSGCGNTASSGQSESTQSASPQSSITEKSVAEPSKEVSQVSETTELSKEESQVSENSKTGSDTNSSDAGSSNTASSKTESSKAESNKASETSKANQSSQNGKTEESSKSSQTSKPAENSQSSQNSNSGQTSQAPQTSKPAETSKPIEISTVPQTSLPHGVNANSLSIDKKNITLSVDEIGKLTVSVEPSNADLLWDCSDLNVASVNPSDGSIRGLSAGTATITIRSLNGKSVNCNVTVKGQPTKKKLTHFNLHNNGIWVKANETACSMLFGVCPWNADISDLKVVFTENPDNLVSFQKVEKEDSNFDGSTYRLYFNVKPRNKDCVAQATISCGGFSETLRFRIQTKYDSSLAAYYPPYDIDQIVKDMREYGENLGMEWYEPFYVKWYDNHSRYENNAGFFFPVSTGVNGGVTGINLKDALFGSIREPHETLGGSYTSMYFKVVPVLNEKANEWEFYVLYG